MRIIPPIVSRSIFHKRATFGLEYGPPFFNQSVCYIPLRQSTDPSRYILGRTFLQETYIIANYESANITLYPTIYPDSAVVSDIIPICPLNSTDCSKQSPSANTTRLGAANIAGIVVGSVVGLTLLGSAAWWILRTRLQQLRQDDHVDAQHGTQEYFEKAEMPSEARSPPIELPGNHLQAELSGCAPIREVLGFDMVGSSMQVDSAGDLAGLTVPTDSRFRSRSLSGASSQSELDGRGIQSVSDDTTIVASVSEARQADSSGQPEARAWLSVTGSYVCRDYIRCQAITRKWCLNLCF